MRGLFSSLHLLSHCGAREEEEEIISCRLSMVDQALAANPNALGESGRVESSFLLSKAGSSSQSSLSSGDPGKKSPFCRIIFKT